MERFRAIMEAPAPEKPASSVFAPRADPYLQAQPVFNPAGRSVAPLASGISRPIGLTPLAGIGEPPPAPPKKTSLVQPPPWASDSSKNPTFPQRQF
jgi:hypothetical protein